MPVPEPTAEELAYGRQQARIHGYSFDQAVFAAGYALGARHGAAQTRVRVAKEIQAHADQWAPPGGNEHQRRMRRHLFIAVQVATGKPTPERAAEALVTGNFVACHLDEAGQAVDLALSDPDALDFGPEVACSCGPDSVAHIHDAPWGCTTCSCRFYVAFEAAAPETEVVYAEDVASIARTMEGIRFTPVDIPLADADTPEQTAMIPDQSTAAITACRIEYERPGRRDRGDRIVRCHLPAGHLGDHEEADTAITWTDRHV